MADTRAPPTFHQPQVVPSPEFDTSLRDRATITDGILFRTFKTILPADPQELNQTSRSISFYILDKLGLINPHQ